LQILFTLDDGLVIETVVIPCVTGRTTVCVSSQVGCAMNCQFCYTGRQAFFSVYIDQFSGYTVFTFTACFSYNVILQNGSQETSYCRRNSRAGCFCKTAIHEWNWFHHQCCIYGRSTIALRILKLVVYQFLLCS